MDKFAVWASEWRLNVNIEKTYTGILHIGYINSVAIVNEVKSCTSIRELEVAFDSKMHFDLHIENVGLVRDAYIFELEYL